MRYAEAMKRMGPHLPVSYDGANLMRIIRMSELVLVPQSLIDALEKWVKGETPDAPLIQQFNFYRDHLR